MDAGSEWKGERGCSWVSTCWNEECAMPVIVRENGIEMSKEAARPVTDRLGKGSNLVLGLATGAGQICQIWSFFA
jgi:protein-tyrosine-phosphatase